MIVDVIVKLNEVLDNGTYPFFVCMEAFDALVGFG
jgi:hypothetical protein